MEFRHSGRHLSVGHSPFLEQQVLNRNSGLPEHQEDAGLFLVVVEMLCTQPFSTA